MFLFYYFSFCLVYLSNNTTSLKVLKARTFVNHYSQFRIMASCFTARNILVHTQMAKRHESFRHCSYVNTYVKMGQSRRSTAVLYRPSLPIMRMVLPMEAVRS